MIATYQLRKQYFSGFPTYRLASAIPFSLNTPNVSYGHAPSANTDVACPQSGISSLVGPDFRAPGFFRRRPLGPPSKLPSATRNNGGDAAATGAG